MCIIELICVDMTWHDMSPWRQKVWGFSGLWSEPKGYCWTNGTLSVLRQDAFGAFLFRMRTAPLDFILNLIHLLPCLGLEGYWMLHMLLASGCSANDLGASWMQLWTSTFGFWIKCMFLMLLFFLHRLHSSLLKGFFTNITSKYRWQMMYKFNNENKALYWSGLAGQSWFAAGK